MWLHYFVLHWELKAEKVVVQTLGHVGAFVTLWTAACQASLSFTISWSLLKLSVLWVGDAIQPPHPLLSPSSTFSLSQPQGLFQWVSSSHQVAQVLELQLQHQSFSEYSGLISFRIDGFDLAVQGTLKSLFQPVWKYQFFSAQPSLWSNSYLHMTTGKTITLTI